MRQFPVATPGFIICFILLWPAINSNAQSIYDANGKVKSVEQRRYEESQNKKNTYTPKTEPTRPSATKPGSDGPALSTLPKEKPAGYGKYDFVGAEDANGMREAKLNGKWGYINKEGKEVVALQYENVGHSGYGLYGVVEEGKWGFVDKEGRIQIACQFYYIVSDFNREGIATVKLNNRDVLINKKGELVISANRQYHYIHSDGKLHDGLKCVSYTDKEGVEKYGFVDAGNNEIIPLIYDDAGYFNNGLAAVKINGEFGKWGAIDKSGKVVIPFLYAHMFGMFEFNERGIAKVKVESNIPDRYGFIDRTGKVVIPLIYEEAGKLFTEGCIPMKLNGDWGFIDSIGQTIIPFIYLDANNFSEGMASVQKETDPGVYKFGFIDKAGQTTVPFIYDETFYFSHGMAKVMNLKKGLSPRFGFINKAGETVIPLIYYEIDYFNDGMTRVMNRNDKFEKKYGFINIDGKVIVPVKYDDIGKNFYENSWVMVSLKGKLGGVDRTGKIIIPIQYDKLTTPLDPPGIYGVTKYGITIAELNGEKTYFDKDGKEIKM